MKSRFALRIGALAAALSTGWLASLAVAQAPMPLAPPDPARYPALASLVTWLRSPAPDAKNCSATVAMALSARVAYERTGSESAAVDAIARGLVTSTKGQLNLQRARVMAVGYVRTAQAFLPLPADAAGLGIAQLCRSAVERGDRPFGDQALVRRLVEEARACTAIGFADKASNYVPLECVVSTIGRR